MSGRAPLRPAAAGTIIAILALLVLAADQLAKHFTLQNLPFQEPVHVIGDFLIFYLTRNSGAAFSLGADATWIFTIALSAVVIAIVWLAATRVRSRLWAVALGLLLGGVLGNLGDRLFRDPGFGVGHVVDFIDTPWMWFIPGMPGGIYNIADMFIVSMMIGVAILVLVGLHLDGSREKKPADEQAAAEQAAAEQAAAEQAAAQDAAVAECDGAESARTTAAPAGGDEEADAAASDSAPPKSED